MRPNLLVAILLGLLSGCIGTPGMSSSDSSDPLRTFPLDTLETTTVTLGGRAIEAWLADTDEKQTEGLMFVTSEELGERGMLFVFSDERLRGFWMRNTVTSLDIAYARMDGTIVATHTMPPLTLRTFSSIEPAMFALEVRAGLLAELGVEAGDRLTIPDSVFKTRG